MAAHDDLQLHPTFSLHILPCFQEKVNAIGSENSISCMKKAIKDGNPIGFDLGDINQVKAKSQKILLEVAAGNMPQGGPAWGINRVRNFARWMDQGYAP
ncbi:MAG: hypothetical protein PHD65_02435 [Gallionella sp.]|nr:hypothetical protein [Gallionella sp.]